MKIAVFIIALTFVGLAILACNRTDSPEIGAREFLEAFAEIDETKVMSRTCRNSQPKIQEQLQMLSTTQEGKPDIASIKITLISLSSETADVLVGIPNAPDLWTMVREDGTWKFCGTKGRWLGP
ncbi:MAG: hypothetical protein B6D41_08695 [Chloroflexi bacterium UTCFX4]|nr:MAG: hypothetical protein B6D41_08695 [Chloroflexi bacterium UTCFX4]